MSELATVNIGWDSNGSTITVNPAYKEWADSALPNSVQWVIDSQPTGAVGMQIVWKNRAPFTAFGMSTTEGGAKKLVASGYNGGKWRYDYWVRFFDSEGKVLAEIDPGVGGSGDNPDWPTDP